MTACAPVSVPVPLSAELRSDVAYRRARGASWDAVAAAAGCDPDTLRRAATADPLFAAAYEREWADAVREAEADALRRLQKLTASEDEQVALRASVVVVRYAVAYRRADDRRAPAAPRTPPPAPLAPPRVEKEATPRPAPTAAIRREPPLG
jgi:hypothetical protein